MITLVMLEANLLLGEFLFLFYFIFPKYIIIVKNDAFFSRDKMLKLMKKTLTNISNNNLTEIRMTIF